MKLSEIRNILREEENKTNEEWSVSNFRGFARGNSHVLPGFTTQEVPPARIEPPRISRVFAPILSVDDPSEAPSTSALAQRASPVLSRAIDARYYYY